MTPQAGKSNAGAIAAAVAVVLLLYALSPPLLAKICGTHPPMGLGNFLLDFYAPLRWLDQHVAIAREFYQWYGHLWGY